MEEYLAYILLVLWLSIGAISYVIDEKSDPAETRGEFIVNVLVSSIFGLVSLMITISCSDWWNEKIN